MRKFAQFTPAAALAVRWVRVDCFPDKRVEMKHGFKSISIVVFWALAAGCAWMIVPVGVENPASITLTNYETVWETTVEVLEKYFKIGYENRYDGRIETRPVVAATLFEPWLPDSVGCRRASRRPFKPFGPCIRLDPTRILRRFSNRGRGLQRTRGFTPTGG